MTCIVGLVENDKVYIGGDSAGVARLDVCIRTDEKVFKKGDMIFGFTSSFRMGQLIRYKLKIPDHDPRVDDYEYLCSSFIDELIKCFKDNGYATINNNEVQGGVFLLGYNKKLYKVDSDFQVGKIIDSFDACGCGENFALGAFYAMKEDVIDPEIRITSALKAAEYFSGGVRAPFNIISI